MARQWDPVPAALGHASPLQLPHAVRAPRNGWFEHHHDQVLVCAEAMSAQLVHWVRNGHPSNYFAGHPG